MPTAASCIPALGRLLWRADVLGDKFDPISYFLLVSLLPAVLVWWGLFGARRNAPECVECGRRFLPPQKLTGLPNCPPCRQRSLGAEGLRRERARGLRTIFVPPAIVACFMGFGRSDLAAARFGRSSWFALPLLAVGATLGLGAALVIAYIPFALIWPCLDGGLETNDALISPSWPAACHSSLIADRRASPWAVNYSSTKTVLP